MKEDSKRTVINSNYSRQDNFLDKYPDEPIKKLSYKKFYIALVIWLVLTLGIKLIFF